MDGDRTVEPSLPRLLSRAIGIAALLALLAAPFVPWFTVPGMTGEPLCSRIYRILTGGVLLAGLVLFARFRRVPQHAARLAFGLLATLLFFPYFIIVWSPDFAGEASWLHAQHESITGSSGDLYLSQETRADAWRQRVDVINRPIASEIVDLPDWSRLDLGRFFDLADWFGAAPWFAIFVRKGWVLALCGSAAALLALAREGAASRHESARILRRGLPALAVAFALALVPPGFAVRKLQAARADAQRGDFAAASLDLAQAGRLFPALRSDCSFVAQQGLFDDACRVASPEAALYRARLLEAHGLDEQAQAHYLAILDAPADRAIHRECLKSVLSLAADALNSGEITAAAALYAGVLAHDPQNLKANYALQIVAVRAGDLARLPALQARMEAVYRTFNSPTKKAVLAFGHENRALAEMLDGNPAAARDALARARHP